MLRGDHQRISSEQIRPHGAKRFPPIGEERGLTDLLLSTSMPNMLARCWPRIRSELEVLPTVGEMIVHVAVSEAIAHECPIVSDAVEISAPTSRHFINESAARCANGA